MAAKRRPKKDLWICLDCKGREKTFPKPSPLECPKCGSEQVFALNDGGWPCPECKEPKLNYDECQAGKMCKDCRALPDEIG